MFQKLHDEILFYYQNMIRRISCNFFEKLCRWVQSPLNPLIPKSAMWPKIPLHAQYLVHFYQI